MAGFYIDLNQLIEAKAKRDDRETIPIGEIAKRTGITRPTLMQLRDGVCQKAIYAHTVQALADYFHVNWQDFVMIVGEVDNGR